MSDAVTIVMRARAEMMLRGQAPLVLILGPGFAARLGRELGLSDCDLSGSALAELAEIVSMPAVVSKDMEGFAVSAAQPGNCAGDAVEIRI